MLLAVLLVAFNTEARRADDKPAQAQTLSALSMEVDANIKAILAYEFFVQEPECGNWYNVPGAPGSVQRSCHDQNYSVSITQHAILIQNLPYIYSVTYCYQGGVCQTYYP